MVADVQGWLDNAGSNNGWIVIGDENNPTTTRRFDSREGGSSPQLLIDYTPTGAVEACCNDTTGDCSLTIVGSGTVSNLDRSKGSCCIAERRMLEVIEGGDAKTPFMQCGDVVRIEMRDAVGASIFGAIEQTVVRYPS